MEKFDKKNINIYFGLKNQIKKELLPFIKEQVGKYGSIQLNHDRWAIGITYNGGLGCDKSISYIYKPKDSILIHCYGDEDKDEMSINELNVDVLCEIAKEIEKVVSKYYE